MIEFRNVKKIYGTGTEAVNNANFVIDKETIIKCARQTDKIITIEDHNVIGGLGSAVCEVLAENEPTKVIRMGINDTFGKSGKAEELMKYFKITSNDIIETIKK